MDPTTPPQAAQVVAQGTPALDALSDGQEPKQYSVEYVKELRAEAAKHRKRAQELEAAQMAAAQAQATAEAATLAEQGKFKELYEASERKAAEAAQKQAAAERKALIAQVAQEAGLPVALWTRVQGDDEAAIRADVATLLPLVQAPAAAPGRVTSGAPTNGARPGLVPAVAPVDLTKPPAWGDIFSKPE